MKHVAYILLVKYASMLCNNIFSKIKTNKQQKITLSGEKYMYVSTVFTDIASQYEGYRMVNPRPRLKRLY